MKHWTPETIEFEHTYREGNSPANYLSHLATVIGVVIWGRSSAELDAYLQYLLKRDLLGYYLRFGKTYRFIQRRIEAMKKATAPRP